jgi:hypothetical protein
MVQVLRTCYHAAHNGGTAKQTILPASAITVELAEAGTKEMRKAADGSLVLAPESALQQAWEEAYSKPFDLFKGPLVRFQVRPHGLWVVWTVGCTMLALVAL